MNHGSKTAGLASATNLNDEGMHFVQVGHSCVQPHLTRNVALSRKYHSNFMQDTNCMKTIDSYNLGAYLDQSNVINNSLRQDGWQVVEYFFEEMLGIIKIAGGGTIGDECHFQVFSPSQTDFHRIYEKYGEKATIIDPEKECNVSQEELLKFNKVPEPLLNHFFAYGYCLLETTFEEMFDSSPLH